MSLAGENFAATVTTTATMLVPVQKIRKILSGSNESATEAIFIGFSRKVSSSGPNKGQRIGPGGSFTFDRFTGELWAVTAANTADVSGSEVYEEAFSEEEPSDHRKQWGFFG